MLLCSSEALAKMCREFLIYAVEAAVGEDSDDIAGRKLRREVGDDGVRVSEELGGRACVIESADDFFRVQAFLFGNALLLKNGGKNHTIGEREAFNEFGRENLAAKSVGARFEYGPKAP